MISNNYSIMPEITVIVPCYNTKIELLEKCVNSVLAQTYNNFELIIVDDGSNNEYKTIYKSIEKKDDRIRVLLKENGGVSSARNYGMQHALGKYIIFADSDDSLVPYFLEEAYTIATKENADFIIGCNIRLSDYISDNVIPPLKKEDEEILSQENIYKIKPYMVGKRLFFQNGLIYIGRGPWSRLIKREIAIATPFDEKLSICEDITWNLQILTKCRKVIYVKRPWYVYNNIQNESATRGYNANAIRYSIEGLMAVKENLKLEVDEEYKAFGERCLEDITVICERYLYNRKSSLGMMQKHQIRKKIYTEEPWTLMNSVRFFKLASGKDKFKWFLFKARLLLIVYLFYT